jgi:hypothetical protein
MHRASVAGRSRIRQRLTKLDHLHEESGRQGHLTCAITDGNSSECQERLRPANWIAYCPPGFIDFDGFGERNSPLTHTCADIPVGV